MELGRLCAVAILFASASLWAADAPPPTQPLVPPDVEARAREASVEVPQIEKAIAETEARAAARRTESDAQVQAMAANGDAMVAKLRSDVTVRAKMLDDIRARWANSGDPHGADEIAGAQRQLEDAAREADKAVARVAEDVAVAKKRADDATEAEEQTIQALHKKLDTARADAARPDMIRREKARQESLDAQAARSAAEQLLYKCPPCRFEEIELRTVLEFMQELCLNMQVDWPRLEAAGVKRDTQLTWSSEALPASEVLAAVLKVAGAQDKAVVSAEDNVVVISTAAGLKASHAAAEATLAGADEKTRAALEKRLPEFKADGIRLETVLEFVRDVTSLRIDVDWQAVDRDAEVHINLRNVKLGQALRLILDQAGGNKMTIQVVAKDGGLLIKR